MLRGTALIATLALAAAGCGHGSDAKLKAAAAKDCMPPKPVSTTPLSPGFPAPTGIVYTGSKTSGSTTVVTAYVPGAIADAVTAYEGAFASNNYRVTKESKHTYDARFEFSGANVDGSIELLQACRNLTSLTIAVTPA